MEEKIKELIKDIQKGPQDQAVRKKAVRELGELLDSQDLLAAAEKMRDVSAGEAGFVSKRIHVFLQEEAEANAWELLNTTLTEAGHPPAASIEYAMEYAVGNMTPQQTGEWYGEEAVAYTQNKMDTQVAPNILENYMQVMRWVNAPGAFDLLTMYINHENKDVQIEAIKAFAGHESPEALQELKRRLDTESDYRILEAISEALTGFTSPEMADFHFSLLRENANAGPRIAAATSLAKMGQTPRLLELVDEMTQDKATHKIIQNILGGIKKSEAPGSIETLIELTKHSHFRVREYSVKSLAWVSSPEAIDAIRAVLERENYKENYVTRESAVKTLAYLGDVAVPILALAINDVDRPEWAEAKPNIYKTVGEYAREALQTIGSPEAIEILNAWQTKNAG